MNPLRSLASLNMKKTRFQTKSVTVSLVAIIVFLLIFRIPRDIQTVATSIPMRILWIIITFVVVSNYGIIDGILLALIHIILLTDVQVEGMTNDTTNTKDPVKDALDKVRTKSVEKPLPPPGSTKPETNDTTPIETMAADANEQGTTSQIDKDRAMKLSSHMNSKDDSILHQMKKEKEIEKTQPKEGFTPMTSSYGGNSLSGTMF